MKNQILLSLTLLLGITVLSCNKPEIKPPVQSIQIEQNWGIKSGDKVGNAEIISSLGEVAIKPNKKEIVAPYSGTISKEKSGWVIYESPHFPGFLVKITGLSNVKEGSVKSKAKIGNVEKDIINVSLLLKRGENKQGQLRAGQVEINKKELEKMFP